MAFERVGVEAVVEGLGRFKSGMGEVNAALGLAGEEARKTQKETEALNKTMTAVGAGMLAAGGATLAFMGSAVKLAARVETLGVVTKRLGENVGFSETEIRSFEQAIVDQGITLRASRSAIARMVQAQIDLTKSSQLARLAQDAAVIANINSSEAFERLTFVITSGNVRMARNLGLQVSFQAEYEKMGKAIGVAAAELTSQQKIQARTNAVMAAGERISGAYAEAMTTAGKKLLSLDRHLEESRRIMGEAWLPLFADAIDLVTSLLKGFQNLSDGTKSAISSFVGIAAIIAVVMGAAILLIPQVVAAKAALDAMTASTILSTGALAAWAIAIAAIAVAGIRLIAFIKDTDATSEKATTAIKDHNKEILFAAENYKEYADEIERVNKLTDENRVLGVRLVREQETLTEAVFDQNRALKESDDRLLVNAQRMHDAAFGAADLRTEEEKLADAELEAARQADVQAASTAFLERKMSDLSTVIGSDLTKNAKEYEDTLADLEGELVTLDEEHAQALEDLDISGADDVARAQERLAELQRDELILLTSIGEAKDRAEESDKERSASTILREQDRLQAIRDNQAEAQAIIDGASDAQIAAADELNTEFAADQQAIRDQIEETKQAFSDQTARMIFDMAQQRLAIDGLTREEIAALTDLAGPEGLGIIDEAAVALLEGIDTLATDLEKPGDQSEIVAEKMGDMFDIVRDGTGDIDDMATAIRNMPVLDLVAVRTAQGDEIFVPRASVEDFIRGGRQFGGPISRGAAMLVGERGPEVFAPGGSGNIISNRAIKSLAAVMAAAPVAAPGAGGGGSSQTDNFNMTINTAAPVEQISQDFEFMRAMSGRQRGGL